MHFIRLIRPVNLLIIAFTMYCCRLFLYIHEQLFDAVLLNSKSEQFDFFLLVFSTVLIAAAGNIINDYFDVRADRINKPEKLIITKHINRKWAILSHWILNLIAFLIALYLSIRYHTFWYVFIHLLSINALYIYSMLLKRKPFIGNLTIAALAALVPVLCGVHFYVQQKFHISPFSQTYSGLQFWSNSLISNGGFIIILAFFAFTYNLSREIIKDIQDIEGDKQIHAKTLPIILGVKKSKLIASLSILSTPIAFILLFLMNDFKSKENILSDLIIFLPVILSILLAVFSLLILKNATTRIQLKKVDQFIKLSMLMGIILPFYWLFLV